jgi:hypothetical protein
MVILATVGVGCAVAEPVLRLAPESENLFWVGGDAVASREGKTIRAAAAFSRELEGMLGFRVEVQNLTAESILISPKNITYTTCQSASNGKGRVCDAERDVIDPEATLLELDMQHARATARPSDGEAALGVLMLLGAAAAVAGAASGNPGGGIAVLGETANTAVVVGGAMAASSAASNDQQFAYETERSKWATSALRKSTLRSREGIAGLVFMNRHLDADQVILHVHLGSETLDFPFKQVVYPVKPTQPSSSETVL